MLYVSKVLKPWVYDSKDDMKIAYDECWRQKELLESKANILSKFVKNLIDKGCLNEYYHKIAKELTEED